MLVIGWLVGLARRRKARIIGLTLGIAIAVSLIATLGAFFASSESKMTSRAVAGVPVDWQVQLRAGANPAQVRDAIVNATSARSAAVVGYGHVSRFRSRIGGSVQTTGSGMALGLPADYAASFPGEIRYLVGSHSGVLLAQQGAANLHASVGSTVSVVTAPGHSVDMKVQGIIDLPHADSLFQTIGLPASAAPSAPPDNVVIMPLAKWHSIFDAVSKQDPTSASLQVHVKLPPGLPADPGAAFASVQQRANNLEVTLAGKGLVGDNLAAQLDATRGDAIYAELLFLFLGLPGVAVTAAVVGAFGAVDADRRRSEQALLRLRGATRSRLIGLAAMEAISVAIAGSILGLLGAQAIARGVFSSGALGATTRQSTIWGAAATLSGLLLALVTIALPAARAASGISIGRARRLFAERSRPIWMILYLDVVLLAIGGLIYWKAVRSGFQVVLAPEGVPTISVDYFTLLAPLFLWVGAALLVWRCARSLLTRGRRMIAAATKPLSGPLASTVASSMSRQHRLLARGVVVLALTVT
ncbi:MAG: putative transport system permease protein, partial [Actinomycetota bacterium]|nr:putative transport system permease protein [Actinomycetota bacterium]